MERKFADKYFTRSKRILELDGLNPWVNYQIFVRKGPGKAAGIKEAVELIQTECRIAEVGGRIYAKKEGTIYEPRETQLNVIAPVQEVIELETEPLGMITYGVTTVNDKTHVDINAITRNVQQVVELAAPRPVYYFGARHWHRKMDAAISKAAFDGGAKACSTDAGAETVGQKGMGTIPHALENIYAYYFGMENAVMKATEAFDKYMDKAIPRVALVDYANREITDAIKTARALNGNLAAVRIDTCGENYAQGAAEFNEEQVFKFEDGLNYNFKNYWDAKGVSISAALALRQALDKANIKNRVGIVLSSGFSNPEKVKAFNEAEKLLGIQLYDGIGAGFLDHVRTTTSDIVAVGESPDEVDFYTGKGVAKKNIIHKVGRPPKPNFGLERVL